MLAQFNLTAQVVEGFAEFLHCCAVDTAVARIRGYRIVDKFENPNGRVKDDATVSTFPTDVIPAQVVEVRNSLRHLRIDAARICRVDRVAPWGDTSKVWRSLVIREMRMLRHLRMIAPDHWDVWRETEKQHVTDGLAASILSVDGFHQTDSDAGESTVIRYADSEVRDNAKAAQFYAEDSPARLDEDAILAEVEEQELRDLMEAA